MNNEFTKEELETVKAVWVEWKQGKNSIRNIEDFLLGFAAGKKCTNPKTSAEYLMIEMEVWEAGWEN